MATCSICLESQQTPHLLQCGHGFCCDCIIRLFEVRSNAFIASNETELSVRVKPEISCPACRTTITTFPVLNRPLIDALNLKLDENKLFVLRKYFTIGYTPTYLHDDDLETEAMSHYDIDEDDEDDENEEDENDKGELMADATNVTACLVAWLANV